MRYTRTAILLHWLIALLVFGQIGLGWYLEQIPRQTPTRGPVVNFHKSVGLIIGLLILYRLFWRLTHPAPGLPSSIPAWERASARTSHAALYLCMLIMPVSGYIASNFSRWGVNFFNAVKLPPWGPDNHAVYTILNTTHVITSYVFVSLIAIHTLAALRHLAMGDGIVARILPLQSRRWTSSLAKRN
jgi:cytochrome b561